MIPNTIYTKDQVIESITGYLWYDAPWTIIRTIAQFVVGKILLDVGCDTGIMSLTIQNLIRAQGSEFWSYNEQSFETWNNTKRHLIRKPDTIITSHVLEHTYYPEGLIQESIEETATRIIHVVPDGDVNDKNLGTPHLHIYNRKNFYDLFKKFDLRCIHYGIIKGDRMDSLIYVGDKN